MEDKFNLERFRAAQISTYDGYATALREIQNSHKSSHWIWYIFPQLAGLGKSYPAQFYGISDAAEARAYVEDPVLGQRLTEICQALLDQPCRDIYQVMYLPVDAMKLRSSMTLFEAVAPENPIFAKVLDTFYAGKRDYRTLSMLKK